MRAGVCGPNRDFVIPTGAIGFHTYFKFPLLRLIANQSWSATKQDCTDVARDDDPLLVLSTLGGGLTALDMRTNEIKWSIEDGKSHREILSTDRINSLYLRAPGKT